ncbi:MAG: family 38 glycosyl hydrolase [Herbinix sp.]|nr:family 38 glycosyl hydrolase [Herbinix sp.]
MSKIKEIWCMHHSHLDIGYTHPQPLLLELQNDYIDQAIDLCIKTADYPEESRFRWTCEATYPLTRWLETASPDRVNKLKQLIKLGQISVAALPMHTTPGTTAAEMVYMLKDLDRLRDQLDTKITTAINHDVNGQPWPLSQIMLDSGIDFYLTGINIHFGGIPFQRPAAFRWQTPDERELLTFLGEHYSLFSQFFFTNEANTERMHKGITDYVERLENSGYQRDFVFLTATNPPLYDNNCPDLELPDLIRRYNEEQHEQIVRFVTPEMLRDKLMEESIEVLPLHRGDWTDYWNFGCGSTARETKVNRHAKQTIQKAEMIECICESPNRHYDSVKEESCLNALVFDEHTWGASQSVTDPQGDETYSQFIHKIKTAYQAADLSAYLLSTQIERLAGNPHQSNKPEGIIVVNTSGTKQEVELEVPLSYLEDVRQLSAIRSKQYLSYITNPEKTIHYGSLTMEPLSWKKIPFADLDLYKEQSRVNKKPYSLAKEELITPYYRVKFNPETGRIRQICSLEQDWNMLDTKSEWTFFEPVRETIDARHHKQQRSSLFPRDVDLGNKSITVWNHDWKAKREGAVKIVDWRLDQEEEAVSFVWELEVNGMENMLQTVTFSTRTPRIKMKAKFIKKPVTMPESIYFAFPLQLKGNWECCFDTAGEFVRLDKDQLGNVCRDWVTVEKSVSLYDEEKGVILACPDTPMVQIGDFNFGKESREIKRQENPLLLAWPMNNYWDTNFVANQSGAMEFCYELLPFDKFNTSDAYAESMAAEKPYVIGAAVSCEKEESGVLFKGEGDVLPIYVKPAQKTGEGNHGFVVALKNMTDYNQKYTFTIPDVHSFKAEEITVQEKSKAPLPVINQWASINIPPHALKLIRIMQER